MSDRATPVKIHADRAAGTLRLEWADGHISTFDATMLRWLCPCAFCRGEAGMPGWLDSAPTLTADQTRLVDMQLVGQYAVMPSWADGHHTGYYTYALLRDHCPCPECTADRGERHGAESVAAHADHAPSTATQATAGTAAATPEGSRP